MPIESPTQMLVDDQMRPAYAPVQVVATPPAGATEVDTAALLADCRARMPAYMMRAGVHQVLGPLPRNPSGQIDRKLLSTRWAERAAEPAGV